jgi:hypothetical protein
MVPKMHNPQLGSCAKSFLAGTEGWDHNSPNAMKKVDINVLEVKAALTGFDPCKKVHPTPA